MRQKIIRYLYVQVFFQLTVATDPTLYQPKFNKNNLFVLNNSL